MPHEADLLKSTYGSVDERVARLNDRYRNHSATSVLELALRDAELGRIALVSSFGAESVVLLHMISVMKPDTPVIFIDTEMLFPETIQYQLDLVEALDLRDLRRIRPAPVRVAAHDPDGLLHQTDTDSCCALRKTVPLQTALGGFDAWITGRKRFQGNSRQTLDFFENELDMRIKINPLAHWSPQDVQDYIINNRLPRHPLVAKGYPSIGCAPCTSPVKEGEDPRAGRWRGSKKEECGIHFVDGKIVRGPLPTQEPSDAQTDTQDTGDTAMNVIVTDNGFTTDSFSGIWIDLPSDTDPATLPQYNNAEGIRISFPTFSDGRGFTLARLLRLGGYKGKLRAMGHVIADQYTMARRAGFDEVEISADLAARQPADQWAFRANWTANDYQSRLRKRA